MKSLEDRVSDLLSNLEDADELPMAKVNAIGGSLEKIESDNSNDHTLTDFVKNKNLLPPCM